MSASEILYRNLEKAEKNAKEALEAAMSAEYPFEVQQNIVKYNRATRLVAQIKAAIVIAEIDEVEDINVFLDKRKAEF